MKTVDEIHEEIKMNDVDLVIALLEFSHLEYFALEWYRGRWYVNLQGSEQNCPGFERLHDAVKAATTRYVNMVKEDLNN